MASEKKANENNVEIIHVNTQKTVSVNTIKQSKDCLIVLRNVSFQKAGYLLKTLFRTLLHPHAGPLSHHTAESETLPTTKWVSQWAHWKNSGHTCLSLSWDSTAVRKKVVRSAWPRSVTAPVKLWLSTSAARRKSILIHVGLFREWKMTTPSHGV